MVLEATPTALIDLAQGELDAATRAITADSEDVAKYAGAIRKAVDAVNSASHRAIAEKDRLYADDQSNPAWVKRELASIPSKLRAATAEQLDTAEFNLDLVQGIHLRGVLRHDGKDDANLRFELSNYLANLEPEKAATVLVPLAANPRYATYLSGPAGDSLIARFGFKNTGIFRKAALEALATKGTSEQQRRSAALAAVENMRRVIGLARGGRDQVADESQRPPAPAPTQAMMR